LPRRGHVDIRAMNYCTENSALLDDFARDRNVAPNAKCVDAIQAVLRCRGVFVANHART
jgi:hypothetical protein